MHELTFAAAALMHGEGRVLSYDLYESKLHLILHDL